MFWLPGILCLSWVETLNNSLIFLCHCCSMENHLDVTRLQGVERKGPGAQKGRIYKSLSRERMGSKGNRSQPSSGSWVGKKAALLTAAQECENLTGQLCNRSISTDLLGLDPAAIISLFFLAKHVHLPFSAMMLLSATPWARGFLCFLTEII